TLADLLEQLPAARLDVIGEADRPSHRQEPPEKRLAMGKGYRPKIEVFPAQKVEREKGRRKLPAQASNVLPPGELAALLQALEAGNAAVVENHELAVDCETIEWESLQGGCQLGKQRRGIAPMSEQKLRSAALSAGEETIAVVLQLEQPALLGEGLVPR